MRGDEVEALYDYSWAWKHPQLKSCGKTGLLRQMLRLGVSMQSLLSMWLGTWPHLGLWPLLMTLGCSGDDNLVEWTKLDEPAIAHAPEGKPLTGFRDPFIIQKGGKGKPWRLIIGSGTKQHGGTILLYESNVPTHGERRGCIADLWYSSIKSCLVMRAHYWSLLVCRHERCIV